jgi:membrane protein YdbS with pleckstrin-like domain
MADKVSAAFTSVDTWIPVSPRLATARRVTLVLCYIVVVAAIVIVYVFTPAPPWVSAVLAVAAVIVFVWLWWLIGRRVRSFGYCERGDDLLVTSGIMFRRMVIVPYGRMQLVDVKAGPIDRWFGLTTVQLHTAAATTDASIPGLVPDVAADLRDRLARLGEQRSAGL